MKLGAATVIALLLVGAASAAQPSVPPGCLKHPDTPGCSHHFPLPPLPVLPSLSAPTSPMPVAGVSSTLTQQITQTTTLVRGARIPKGTIHITATVAAVRVTDNIGRVGGTRATYMLLWNRSITARPIGQAVTICSSIGSGGALGESRIEECRAYYALPLGKLTAVGISYKRRAYWLAVVAGTGRYLHAGGWLHYRLGRVTITFQ